tara:strand:- start:196 stop:2229 length:2034 start_codon:yes stop_codon:yes gene_type:complete
LAKIIQIPGRSGFYIRVVVPRGQLRDLLGTCDVVKKVGKTKREASENALKAEIEIERKFKEKLRQANQMNSNDLNNEEDLNSNNIKIILENKSLAPCIANKTERTKFEQFKAESKYLKEPLLSELKNEDDHFTNDAVQLLKFHGSYQQDDREFKKKGGIGKDWQMMLRLRNPAGFVPGTLFIALDDLSDRLGNGTLRATVRQCFQMHGIRKDSLKEVISTIIKSMGSTLSACGDINRNVMAPAAPFSNGGYPIARKLALDIADLLSPIAAESTYLELWVNGDHSYSIKPSKQVKVAKNNQFKKNIFSGDIQEPLYGETYMPRKFKCAVTVPGDNSVDILTNDIGLVVFTKKNGDLIGCNVYVGGGMGRTHNLESTFARTADPLGFVEKNNILELIQSILALQRDYGDRKTRRHARLKYVLNDMGIEWFKEQLKNKYFKKELKPFKNQPNFKLEDYLGWHKQGKGLWFVGIPVLSGRLTSDLKKGIRNIIETYKLDMRLTPNQDILLCNIGSYQKRSVEEKLREIGYKNPHKTKILERHALACPALPLCGLAMTEAERFLPEILERIQLQLNTLGIEKSILIRITGCPNGCARPYMAELALVGSGLNQYQLWLGGTPNLVKLAKPFIQKLPIDKLEATIEPLLLSWKDDGCKNSLGEHIVKLGDQQVNELLSKGMNLP